MKSIEAIQCAINDTDLEIYDIDELEEIVDGLKQALKDLEILELLKRHSGIVEIYSVASKEGEHFVCEINDKQDVEKLKGWLKNAKWIRTINARSNNYL